MSIQAMKMALEALVEYHDYGFDREHCFEVIKEIQAAITEAERQEPMTYFYRYEDGVTPHLRSYAPLEAIPLYTHPQPAIPAWQPIETPPQEWGSYLIWHPKYGMETLWFQLKDGGNDGRKAGNWYDEEGDDDYPCNARVTHWMPLPAAPKPGGT